MTGTFLSYYLAFLLQTGGVPAAKAPKAPAAAKPAPAAKLDTQADTKIVFETEHRDTAPVTAPSQSFGRTVVLTPTTVRVAAAPTADEVVDKVQAFYKDITQVTAKFRQVVKNATFGRETTTDGKVYISKPGKMRWDYFAKVKKGKKAPITKSFISDSKYLFVVDKQNKQVVEKQLDKNMLPVAVTFLYGKGDLKKDFTAVLDTSAKKPYGGSADLLLKLTPKTPSTQYKTLYLVVDKNDYRVKESVIVDGANNVNHFRFYEPDFDTKLKETLFKFDKKSVPDYRLVKDDDDAAASGAE
jgi:outer membrane lipoprotein carrier protein